MRKYFLLFGLLALWPSLGFAQPADDAGTVTTDQLPYEINRVPYRGTTQQRPLVPQDGERFFDTDLGCTLVYSSRSLTGWRCNDGYYVPPGAFAFGTDTGASTANTSLAVLGPIKGGVMGKWGCLNILVNAKRTSSATVTNTFAGNLSANPGDLTASNGIAFMGVDGTTTAQVTLQDRRVICNAGSESVQYPVSNNNSQSGTGFGTVEPALTQSFDTSQDFYININGTTTNSANPTVLRNVLAWIFIP